ncbi:MAG: efflux RND transporter permease subunit [Alistipes indistinctus]
MKAKEATQAAMKSVSSSIVAMTTVLMAVFLPVGLMPGAAGKLYQQFAITIAITVCISGINALSLTPALCSPVAPSETASRAKRLSRLVQPDF